MGSGSNANGSADARKEKRRKKRKWIKLLFGATNDSDWGRVKNLLIVLKPRDNDAPLFNVRLQADMLRTLETELVSSYYVKD